MSVAQTVLGLFRSLNPTANYKTEANGSGQIKSFSYETKPP